MLGTNNVNSTPGSHISDYFIIMVCQSLLKSGSTKLVEYGKNITRPNINCLRLFSLSFPFLSGFLYLETIASLVVTFSISESVSNSDYRVLNCFAAKNLYNFVKSL